MQCHCVDTKFGSSVNISLCREIKRFLTYGKRAVQCVCVSLLQIFGVEQCLYTATKDAISSCATQEEGQPTEEDLLGFYFC